MANIIVRPDLGKVLIRKSGVFTIRAEDAALECSCPANRGLCGGIEINSIPLKFRTFELLCLEMGKKFITRQAPRGFEWTGESLLLHGPWPSKVSNLVDINSPTWGDAMRRDKDDGLEHPERSLGFVSDTNEEFVDYVLVTDFLFKDRLTDLELDL